MRLFVQTPAEQSLARNDRHLQRFLYEARSEDRASLRCFASIEFLWVGRDLTRCRIL